MADNLSAARDALLQSITGGPTIQDVGSASLSALSSPNMDFDGAMAARRQDQMGRAQAVYGLLRDEEEMKFARKQAAAKAMMDRSAELRQAVELLDVPERMRADVTLLAGKMYDETPDAVPGMMQDFVMQAASQMGVTPDPERQIVNRGDGEIGVGTLNADGTSTYKPMTGRFPGTGEKPSALQEKIEALVASGLDRATAQGVATGRFKIGTDAFGRSSVLDVATGKTVGEVPEAGPPAAEAIADPSADVRMSDATGSQAFFQNLANTVAGVVGLQPFPETEEAITILDRLNKEAFLRSAALIPGRPSNLVREALRELEATPASVLVSDDRARQKIATTLTALDNYISYAQGILDNPSRYSVDEVSKARETLNAIAPVANGYRTVLDQWDGPAAELPDVMMGLPDNDPYKLTAEEWNSLPPDQQKRYEELVRKRGSQ